MKAIVSTITQRCQVTLPAEVCKLLGVGPRDKVAFTIDDGRIGVVSAKPTLKMVYGSVTPATTTDELLTIIEEAKEEKARRTVEQMQQP